METTPQNSQPQGNESQDNGFGGSLQDKLVLKSSDFKGDFNTIADKGAISDLLSHLGQVFGNTDLISAAKIELACIQDELRKNLIRKHQEAEPQLDFNDVELMTDIQEILESCSWYEDVCIEHPSDMDVHCSGCDITISDVEGEVEVIMSQGQAEVIAEKIMDFLEKRTKDA